MLFTGWKDIISLEVQYIQINVDTSHTKNLKSTLHLQTQNQLDKLLIMGGAQLLRDYLNICTKCSHWSHWDLKYPTPPNSKPNLLIGWLVPLLVKGNEGAPFDIQDTCAMVRHGLTPLQVNGWDYILPPAPPFHSESLLPHIDQSEVQVRGMVKLKNSKETW